MGIATIMRAKCVLMVVSGKDKAEILKEILLRTDHTSGSGFYSAAASELVLIADETLCPHFNAFCC